MKVLYEREPVGLLAQAVAAPGPRPPSRVRIMVANVKPHLRKALIILHDLLMTAIAFAATVILRFSAPEEIGERFALMPSLLPGVLALAAGMYWYFQFYQSKWRFASLPDLARIVAAVTLLTAVLALLDRLLSSNGLLPIQIFDRRAYPVYWVTQVFLLGGPRLAYRYLKDRRRYGGESDREALSTIVVGRGPEVEVFLRALEMAPARKIAPRAILSPRAADRGQSIRGVPVMGAMSDLERTIADLDTRGTPARRIVVTPSALAPELNPEAFLALARQLGLRVSQTQPFEATGASAFMPVEIDDLLLRPSVDVEMRPLAALVAGKRIVVTGGGGSIGGEMCRRVAELGASAILVIETSELALHDIGEALSRAAPETRCVLRLCDIRDRERLLALVGDFRPHLVFHAAALKHVPFLETDWTEGVRTNVFGSINVADAAVAAGADALVVISTDKAIRPTSILGATKRLSEIYAEAMDARLRQHPGRTPTRLLSVRFGNVLGSSGSVVPKFRQQIEAGGPVTVTHPDMVRYFMTIREACELVIAAAAHALAPAGERASVYVLKMGQPVRILELAERMIRFKGLEPGADIEIVFTGMRAGERLNEILFDATEESVDIGVPGVMAAGANAASLEDIAAWIESLERAIRRGDRDAAEKTLRRAVPDFSPNAAGAIPLPSARAQLASPLPDATPVTAA